MKLKCEAFQGDFARCFVLAQDNHCHCAVGDHILTIGANVFIGCEFDCTGIWEKELLKITTYEVILPSSYNTIKNFFLSFNGVTSQTTELIYKKFRNDSVKILDENPDLFKTVPGVPSEILDQIETSYIKRRYYQHLSRKFAKYKFSESALEQVFQKYRRKTLEILNQNPYILCDYGVRIADVDRIVKNPQQSIQRSAAIIQNVLEQYEHSGNVCMPYSIYQKTVKQLSVSMKAAPSTLSEAEELLLNTEAVIYYNGAAYRKKMFDLENNIVKQLYRICSSYKTPNINIDEEICNSEKLLSCRLHEQQRKAVKYAILSGVLIVTGGPGTGKTTVIKVIADIQERVMHKTLTFIAPTGRAASRMKESTGKNSSTIHKHLNLGVGSDSYKANTVIEENCAFVDEVSMLDIQVASKLFESIISGNQIIMFGDPNQLPSVGPGAVLKDMIDSGVIPTVYLTKVFRQFYTSNIYLNCRKIIKGNLSLEYGDDFVLLESSTSLEAKEYIVSAFVSEVKRCGLKNVCCLTPYRRGDTGCDAINNLLQQEVNPPSENKPDLYYAPRHIYFRLGDRVMNLKNKVSVSNGDLGFVTEVDDSSITVRFDDHEEIYAVDQLGELELGYAMTIHKSQGSEFKVVISVLLTSYKEMLQMNLFNTAISRAKEKFILAGNKLAINMAIKNRSGNRDTGLTQKLQLFWKKKVA